MSFTDKTLNCRDCGNEFVFTAGEQEFYAQKGFDNEPTRCSNCRQARKQNRGGGGYESSSRGGGSGGGYSRNSYGSDRGGYSSDRGGYSSDRGQREMHTTTCSSCGGPAQVPFVPRGDKPVYCRDCFQSQQSSSRSNRW